VYKHVHNHIFSKHAMPRITDISIYPFGIGTICINLQFP